MPQLGLGTEIGRVSGGAYDSDALAYFARAGIDSGTQTPSSYDNAARFNGTNQFLSIPSNSTLTVTGTSFTYAFWANAVNTTFIQLIFNKSNASGIEYRILLLSGLLRFQILPDGVTWEARKEINIGAGAVNTWNFYVCRYDSSGGGTMGISINGGAFESLGSVGAITQTLSNTLQIANSAVGVTDSLYTGQLSSIGFWKKALTASEVTALWNNGAGRTYASLDSGLRTNLISWWALNQNSVTADSHGTNALTNNGTVTAPNIGPIVTTTQNSRQLINNFVKGIKSLGLWNSMVCWPLRASQNAGAGLTARSLGGLGAFDGTLAGGTLPSWTANGLSLAASSQMNASVTTVPQNVTLLFAAAGNGGAQTGFAQYFGLQNASTFSSNDARVQDSNSGNGSSITMVQRNSVTPITASASIANPFQNSSNFAFVSGSLNQAGSLLNVRNLNTGATSSATPGTTGTNTLNRLQLNGRWTGSLELGTPHTAAFCGYITPASDGQVSAIYSLYRNTLGIGLALP